MLTKWNKIPSVLKMVCGLILGAVLGLVANEWTWIGIFGDLFVKIVLKKWKKFYCIMI